MFKLLRRISSSIYPRLDRPWSDDATSNAPTIGRKRRLSDDDDDGDDVRDAGSSRKRRAPLEREGMSELGELRGKGTETDPGVKEVTRGVKEVELEDKKEGSSTDDGKGTAEEAPATPEGEPSAAPPPHDPTQPPQGDDHPSTVPNDEAPIVQSEAIAEPPSNDLPDVRTPESLNVEGPLVQVEDEKESTMGAAPDAGNDEVACAAEPVEPSPKPEATTSTPEANDGSSQEQQEQ
ncbi:hypothetical protein EDB83DRAFT_2345095 [Lactarius deliciosus]|nr:hypothetical protein EDB83DRAFT_2345095 [Lactarius deliciosus]